MSARDVVADWILNAESCHGFEAKPGKSTNDYADEVLQALDAAGYAIVPKVPTASSFHVLQMAGVRDERVSGVYIEMLEAAKEDETKTPAV